MRNILLLLLAFGAGLLLGYYGKPGAPEPAVPLPDGPIIVHDTIRVASVVNPASGGLRHNIRCATECRTGDAAGMGNPAELIPPPLPFDSTAEYACAQIDTTIDGVRVRLAYLSKGYLTPFDLFVIDSLRCPFVVLPSSSPPLPLVVPAKTTNGLPWFLTGAAGMVALLNKDARPYALTACGITLTWALVE